MGNSALYMEDEEKRLKIIIDSLKDYGVDWKLGEDGIRFKDLVEEIKNGLRRLE